MTFRDKNRRNIVEKIIASHTDEEVYPGKLLTVNIDFVYIQDGNSPTIARMWKDKNLGDIKTPDKVKFIVDHSVLSPSLSIADRINEARVFADLLNVDFIDNGQGISHILAAENNWFTAGNIVLGSDSHTCLGGAFQSLSLGMGATDIVAAMLTNKTWLKVPETVVLNLVGKPHSLSSAKDILLYVLQKIPMETFLYKSVEWCGDWLKDITDDEAMTIASMAVEMGAKCVFLPPRRTKKGSKLQPTGMGNPTEVIDINIDNLTPRISIPHLPGNVVDIEDVAGTDIGQVFVGSCTNGHIDDFKIFANIIRGKSINPNLLVTATPGSQKVEEYCIKSEIFSDLRAAGVVMTPPGCGPCVGAQGPIPASNRAVLSTMNRNFRGRMGNPNSPIFLASPAVAAYTALLGHIPSLTEMEEM